MEMGDKDSSLWHLAPLPQGLGDSRSGEARGETVSILYSPRLLQSKHIDKFTFLTYAPVPFLSISSAIQSYALYQDISLKGVALSS
jgi:hypothetical protein